MSASSETNSAVAASLLKHEKFHAVFLDMRMPALDGLELAKQIRASRTNASAIIVMITGVEDRTLMRRAFEAGIEFFLFKPIERNKLLRLIRAAENPIERERRRFTRIRLPRRVFIESGNDRLDGRTLDLSLGGAMVQSRRTFPPGTAVAVSLELVASAPPILSGARVVRTIGTDCMGIQFENLGPKESTRLQEHLLPLILSAS
jgi:response regulator RpfG family c-di-GMP phosphodiesterase